MRTLEYLGRLWPPLILIAGLGFTAINQAQSRPEEPLTDEAASGVITGKVVNQSGQGLPNVRVSLHAYSGRDQVVTTDGEGNFRAAGLGPTAYFISATAPTYVQAPRDPDINPIGYYHSGDSVRIEMIKGGVITGTIKKNNGDPVVLITVRAFLVRDSKGQRRSPLMVHVGRTDDRGVYRIYGLPPGTYVVATEGGYPSNFNVQPYEGDAPTYAPASTRDTASEITVDPGEEVANVDIRYREEPGHSVSGTVTGAAVSQTRGFSVGLVSLLNGIEQASYSAYQPPGSSGFMISGVPDGEYKIIAETFSPPNAWWMSEGRKISVRGADVNGIELAVKPLASISGAVTLEDSKASECQGKRRPRLGEIVISAWHNEKTAPKDMPESVWGAGSPVTPEPQGSFVLQNLNAGQYRFVTRPLVKYWYLKSISWPAAAKAVQVNQPADAARNWTTIKTGDKYSGLAITFAAGAASIAGQVEAQSGQTLASRVFVYLAPAEPDKREDILRYYVSLAAEDGSFLLSNLAPGRYWITAQPAAAGDSSMLTKLRTPDETELRARILHDGEADKTQTELRPCQNLTDYHLPYRPQ